MDKVFSGFKKSVRTSMTFAPHNEANVDTRNSDKNDPFKYSDKSAKSLQKAQAKRVHISPTGLVTNAKDFLGGIALW